MKRRISGGKRYFTFHLLQKYFIKQKSTPPPSAILKDVIIIKNKNAQNNENGKRLFLKLDNKSKQKSFILCNVQRNVSGWGLFIIDPVLSSFFQQLAT